jgi:hypothetical protein
VLVSEEFYLKLKRIEEHRRNLKEVVFVRVYELVNGYKKDLERIRKESDQKGENIQMLTENLTRERREADNHKKILKERE